MKIDKLQVFSDGRGDLIPFNLDQVPFEVKRMFYVTNVPVGCVRGHHAHYTTQQYLICLKGRIEVMLQFDAMTSSSVVLQQNEGILVDRMVWDSQRFLTHDDVLLVLCSTSYDIKDYILDFKQFENEVNLRTDSSQR